MSRGNSRSRDNLWIGYCHLSHTLFRGYKKKKLGHPLEESSGDVPWGKLVSSYFFGGHILGGHILGCVFIIAYTFISLWFDLSLMGIIKEL